MAVPSAVKVLFGGMRQATAWIPIALLDFIIVFAIWFISAFPISAFSFFPFQLFLYTLRAGQFAGPFLPGLRSTDCIFVLLAHTPQKSGKQKPPSAFAILAFYPPLIQKPFNFSFPHFSFQLFPAAPW
jgi:hypothetical protein